MAAEVVSIAYGDAVPSAGTVSDNLIEFLEDCLQRAKSGEIVGMVGAMAYPAKVGYIQSAGTFIVGYSGAFATIGALEVVKMNIAADLGD